MGSPDLLVVERWGIVVVTCGSQTCASSTCHHYHSLSLFHLSVITTSTHWICRYSNQAKHHINTKVVGYFEICGTWSLYIFGSKLSRIYSLLLVAIQLKSLTKMYLLQVNCCNPWFREFWAKHHRSQAHSSICHRIKSSVSTITSISPV